MKDILNYRRKIFYFILTGMSILFFILSIFVIVYDYISIKGSVYISSKIISLESNTEALVKYMVNNKEYTNTVTLKRGSTLGVNDTLKIRVSIKKPLLVVKKHTLIYIFSFIASIILFLLSYKKSKAYILKDKNIKNLKTTGIYIVATITDILINNASLKYKGNSPYKLRCKYLNPVNNQVYTFDSEDTYNNLNEVLAKYGTKGVVVYLEKDNPSNYFVDLDSLIPHFNLIDPIEFMKTKEANGNQESNVNNQVKDNNLDNTKENEDSLNKNLQKSDNNK